jgi:four helix bundle protein
VKAQRVEDLAVWRVARELARAVFVILKLPAFRVDYKLRDQLNDSTDSIISNIAEGFGQSTDRAFARYLTISRASALEVKTHLTVALDRGYLSVETCAPQVHRSVRLAKMLLTFIQYLRRSDRRDRLSGL